VVAAVVVDIDVQSSGKLLAVERLRKALQQLRLAQLTQLRLVLVAQATQTVQIVPLSALAYRLHQLVAVEVQELTPQRLAGRAVVAITPTQTVRLVQQTKVALAVIMI
jgi:hypothetical protein